MGCPESLCATHASYCQECQRKTVRSEEYLGEREALKILAAASRENPDGDQNAIEEAIGVLEKAPLEDSKVHRNSRASALFRSM